MNSAYQSAGIAQLGRKLKTMMNSHLFISKIRCSTVLLPNWTDKSDFIIDDHVDIWRLPMDQIKTKIKSFLKYLSPQETKIMNRLKKESEKVHYILGKGFLKFLTSKYLDCAPMDIEIELGMNDKPYIKDVSEFNFNISYAQNWVIFGFCNEEVGVDIEYVDKKFDFFPLINEWFTKPEANFIERAYSPRHEFFKLWTRKESLLKATSLGTVDDLQMINCLDGIQYIPYEVGRGFTDWKIKSLLMDDLYLLSISFPVHLRKMRFFEIH